MIFVRINGAAFPLLFSRSPLLTLLTLFCDLFSIRYWR